MIDEQNGVSGGNVASLIKDYEPLRRLVRVVLEARWLATVGKSSSLATIGRSGFDDGTVEYGDGVVHSAAAAQVKRFQGLLGAMMPVISRCVDELEDMIDPNRPQRKDMRVTCGRCPDPNERHRKQPMDARHCKFCGASMVEEQEGAA